MSVLGLKGPRRALYIVNGPTPFHPRYPLLGFRVPFLIRGIALLHFKALSDTGGMGILHGNECYAQL